MLQGTLVFNASWMRVNQREHGRRTGGGGGGVKVNEGQTSPVGR